VLWDGASLVGELGVNRLLSNTNGVALDPAVTRDAWGSRVTFEPSYFQVLPNLDLTVPLGLGMAFGGRSALGPNVFGPHNGGDMSIGISAEYQKKLKFGLQWTHYLGRGDAFTKDAARSYSYGQTYKDRDFISFSMQATF